MADCCSLCINACVRRMLQRPGPEPVSLWDLPKADADSLRKLSDAGARTLRAAWISGAPPNANSPPPLDIMDTSECQFLSGGRRRVSGSEVVVSSDNALAVSNAIRNALRSIERLRGHWNRIGSKEKFTIDMYEWVVGLELQFSLSIDAPPPVLIPLLQSGIRPESYGSRLGNPQNGVLADARSVRALTCVVEHSPFGLCDVLRTIYHHSERFELDEYAEKTDRDGAIEHLFCRNYLDLCLIWPPPFESWTDTEFDRPLTPLVSADACRYLMKFGLLPTLTREQLEVGSGTDRSESPDAQLRRTVYDEAWTAAGNRFSWIYHCLSDTTGTGSDGDSFVTPLLPPLARLVAEYESYNLLDAIESSYKRGCEWAGPHKNAEMQYYEAVDTASLLTTLRAEMRWLSPPASSAAASSTTDPAGASTALSAVKEYGPSANTEPLIQAAVRRKRKLLFDPPSRTAAS